VVELGELDGKLRRSIEEYLDSLRRPAEKGLVRVYCPNCLSSSLELKSVLKRSERKGRLKCYYCGTPMRLADEEFYRRVEVECERWYEHCRTLLGKVFGVLKTWWLPGLDRVEVDPCRELRVVFDMPSRIVIGRDSVYLYLHWLRESQLNGLKVIVDAVRSLNVKLHIEVDGRWDHCEVAEERMAELGFRRDRFWRNYHLEVQ